jgi:hypothetical protein
VNAPAPARGAYAGIGAREAPGEVLAQIEAIAAGLARLGWTLRTGMSPGADQGFYRGALAGRGPVELYLPCDDFQAGARLEAERGRVRVLTRPTADALELAPRFYVPFDGRPWDALDACEQALLARDAHQVLGEDLASPAAFVVCWTPGGGRDGRDRRARGTGQALRIACARSLPVFNVANPQDLEAVRQRVA